MVADDEDGGMTTAGYTYVAEQKKKEEDKEDDKLSLTLSRDELDVVEDFADQLGNYYGEWGQLWGWGVGAVAGVGMLMVDGLACAAAVGSAGILTGGCVAALYLTVFGVPALGIVAGELGGGIASDDAYALGGYISEALADNPDLDEFTISIQKNTYHETILPGGVGPTYTNYSIQITGMDSPVTVSGYAGDEVISRHFGVTP
jgi:hypothetical protein